MHSACGPTPMSSASTSTSRNFEAGPYFLLVQDTSAQNRLHQAGWFDAGQPHIKPL